jgi:hypothetical protein
VPKNKLTFQKKSIRTSSPLKAAAAIGVAAVTMTGGGFTATPAQVATQRLRS